MEQWFDEKSVRMVGGTIGTFLTIICGVVGAFCGICVFKGWTKLLYTIFIFIIAVSVVLLIIGIAALICKQPRHVWHPFVFTGLLGTILFSILFLVGKRITEYEV